MSSVFFPPPSLLFQHLVNMGSVPEDPFPPINVWETPYDFLLFCSMPRIQAENFSYQSEGNCILISGSIPEETGTYVRQERMIGKFSRRIQLPKAHLPNIQSKIAHGLVELRVPKKEPAPLSLFRQHIPSEPTGIAYQRKRPVTDILAVEEGFIVTVEVPSVLLENLRIERTEKSIRVYARTFSTMKENASLVTLEFSEAEYSLEIALPAPERGEEIQATMKNGVLRLFVPIMPMRDGTTTKIIPIQEA